MSDFDISTEPWMDDTDLSGEISNTADTLQGSDIANWNPGGSSSNWLDDIWSTISSPTAKNLLNLGSGIYGLTQANALKGLASKAFNQSDPFGSQRPMYAAQLMQLMQDPNSITKDPSYKFQFDQGADAVQRKMAAGGYLGSGNEGVALTQYGQNFANTFLDDRMKFLAGLAGANISPNFSASLSGYASGIDTASASLASLGYGSTMAGQPPPTPHPNSAGGEAAAIGSIAKGAGGLVSTVGGNSTLGGGISSVGGLYSGLVQGGLKGYGSAVSSAAQLAKLAGFGGTGTTTAGVAGNLASGNYGGAAGGIAQLAAGDDALNAVGSGAYADSAVLGGSAGTSTAGTIGGLGVGQWAGVVGGLYGLTQKQGRFRGTASAALAGFQSFGVPGAIIGGILGYARNGGIPQANPIKASGFNGINMDQAWREQDIARLASNPLASITSKLGVGSNTVAGKLLDPASMFSGHKGSHWRNWDAFNKANPGITVNSDGNYVLPSQFGNKVVNQSQLDQLAGTWYGATYAPDGNQASWQQKFQDTLSSIGG